MCTGTGLLFDQNTKVTVGAVAVAMTLSSSIVSHNLVIPSIEEHGQAFSGQRNYSLSPTYHADGTSIIGIGTMSILPVYFSLVPSLRANMERLSIYQSLLMELRSEIQNIFQEVRLSIDQNFDENGLFCGLYIGIHTNMSVDEAMKALDELDNAYILPNMERLKGIVVDVVF